MAATPPPPLEGVWQGTWLFPTNLVGTGFTDHLALARIIINIMVFVPIAWFCWAWFTDSSKEAYAFPFSNVRHGTYALALWYLFLVLDLGLHEGQIATTYGYIITDFFWTWVCRISEVLLIAGTHRVVCREIFANMKRPLIWRLGISFVTLVLAAMALFEMGSRLATEVLWLQVADYSDVLFALGKQNAFATAFVVLQFLLTLAIMIVSFAFSGDVLKSVRNYSRATLLLHTATIFLWARALSELVYVCRYYTAGVALPDYGLVARDAGYGFFSVVFSIAMLKLVDEEPGSSHGYAVVAQVKKDCQDHLFNALDEMTNRGTQQPPAMRTLLQTMKGNRSGVLSTGSRDAVARSLRARDAQDPFVEYMREIETNYGHFVPVATREH